MKTQRTDQKRTVRWLSTVLLFGVVVTLMLPVGAWAAGTASGITISNTASVDYQVGSVAQPQMSDSTTFVVDNKVDLTVVSQGDQGVSTNQTGAALEFVVTNTGNSTQGYRLESVPGTTNIPMSNVEVRIESGANAGFQDAEDTVYDPSNPPQVAADGQITVYIIADAPGTATNGAVDTYWLRATTLNAGQIDAPANVTAATSGADNTGSVDNVFADADADGAGTVDGQHNGQHADSANFTVSVSNLTVTKSSAVVEDPFNSTTNPKAIPGAYVEYTITITNAPGGATATSVIFSDDLSTEIGNGTLVFRTNSYAGGGINVAAPDINAGASTDLTNAGGDDEGDYNVTASNTVTVNCGDLDAGESATVKFQVIVQ